MEFFDYVTRINNERRQKGKKPFKPIIGCELYVAPGVKEDKKPLQAQQRLSLNSHSKELSRLQKHHQDC